MKIKKPTYYLTEHERHLMMPYDYMLEIGIEAVLDILLDHGFTTVIQLTRLDDVEQNIVEFVQDLNIDEGDQGGGVKFMSFANASGKEDYH